MENGWTEKINQLQNAMIIADGRLFAAAKKSGVLYTGCDTPDGLADKILELKAINDELLVVLKTISNRHDEKAKRINFTSCGCDYCAILKPIIAKADR